MAHELLVEGRAVTPQGLREVQIGVDGGLISKVARQGLAGERRIRAAGCLIFPGFIDAHVHLREPGWEAKEDFRTGTLAAAHGGVTTVLDMPNNPVPVTTRARLEAKAALANLKGVVDIRLFAGVTEGNLGRLGEMAQEAVGYKAYLAESTGALSFPKERLGAALGAVAATKKRASFHCEDQETISRSREKAAFSARRPPQAEARAVADLLSAAREAPRGTMVNVCHVSTGEALRSVKAARQAGVAVTCEATLHHLFFAEKPETAREGKLRTNPPIRGEDEREALLAGLANGDVDMLVTDHAPHTEREKAASDPPSGVPGLDNYANVVTWLVAKCGISPLRIAEVAARNPARAFGLENCGEVAAGMRADLAVLDMRGGDVCNRESLMTKCGWSPYEGVEFPGGVRFTVAGGRVVVEDGAPAA